MNDKTIEQINQSITYAINKQDIFGASYSLIDNNTNQYSYVGFQGKGKDKIPLTPNMIYDLASLTKVIGTTTRIFQLLANNKIHLTDRIGKYLIGITYPDITIEELLMHESGLPADFENVHQMNQATLIKKVRNAQLMYEPGTKTLYSDLNYILLGWLIETIDQTVLDIDLTNNVFAPLGMKDTTYNPARARSLCVPTEFQADRGGIIRGQVHDYKAYLLDGVSGHAGLFSTLADITRFVRALLAGGSYIGIQVFPDIFYKYLKSPKYRKNGRSLGWAVWNMHRNMFWHTGFTGTSVAFDLDKKSGFICLTNAVYPTRKNKAWINDRRATIKIFFNEDEAI